jgi:hypothetical protein
MANETIKVDYKKLNELKHAFLAIQKQIVNDHIAETGSQLFKEDATAAALICLLVHAYEVEKP